MTVLPLPKKHATGGVSNAGTITTPNGGFVYLIGAQVENSGIITTPSGEAILAAGSSVELVDSADPSMRVKVSAKALPVNLSQAMIQSNGNIFSVLNSGKISANSAIVGQNGKIQLRSAGTVTTTTTSVLEAKGDANTDGGLIRGFADGAGHYSGSFNVSGRNGGSLETSAAFLYLERGLSVSASAFAAGGHSGKWLLDPYDFDIGVSEASTIQSALNTGISVDVDTGSYNFYAGGTPINNNGSNTNNGRITMTNASINVTYAGPVSLTFDADEKVIITNSSITGSGSGFDFEINAGLDRSSLGTIGGVSIIGSTIRTNGGGSLDIFTNTGNIGISGSHLSSMSPSTSGSSSEIDIAAYSGSVNINNSDITFINTTPYAGDINLYAASGDINIINQSQIGSNSGDVNVNIEADNGNVNIASSSIGVKTGSLGSSIVGISAYSGNITMTGADSTHSIRADEVDLLAEMAYGGSFGNIGQSGNFIVTDAERLSIGDGATQNAFVTDLSLLRSADMEVVNDAELQLQQGASLNSYGSFISIVANSALIASAGDIVLNSSSIDFFSGQNSTGSFVIITPGTIMLDNSSGIATHHSSYGGADSLNLFASNLILDHDSSILADFVGLNYDIGGPDTDAAKRLALAAFAKTPRSA